MKALYIITFDPHKYDPVKFHKAVTKVEPAEDRRWWHYLSSTYLLATTASIHEIQEHIRKSAPNSSFLVLRVDTTNMAGMLPKKAWEWIRANRPT